MVEELPDQVSDQSVPAWLSKLNGQRRIFGWELEVYRHLNPIMQACTGLIEAVAHLQPDDKVPAKLIQDVVTLDNDMSLVQRRLSDVGNPIALRNFGGRSAQYKTYFEQLGRRSYMS